MSVSRAISAVALKCRDGESFAARPADIVTQKRNPFVRNLLFFFVFFAAFLVSVPLYAASNKLDRALRSAVERQSSEKQPIIVRAKPGQLGAVRGWLQAHGDIIDSEQAAINALTTNVSVEHLNQLASLFETDTLSFNAPVTSFGARTLPPSSPAATILRTTLGLSSTGATGKGIGVAIIDTGVNPSSDFLGRFTAFYDFVNAGGAFTAAYDDNGHGTHIAGLIASNGALGSAYTGVAPDAHIVVMKVLDKTGSGKTSDVIDAIDFAVANRQTLGIDIINLSLGHPIYESATTDPLVQAVEAASRAGVIVVAAAGNIGVNPTTGQSGYAGITCPGNAPSAITVGTSDDANTVDRSDDRVTPYSSAGPTWYDALPKPDLVAPGHHLVSDATTKEYLYITYPQFRVDTNHIMLSGTSMSAAVVSGALAVVLEATRTANRYPLNPSLTPNAAKAILQYTAIPLSDDSGAQYDWLHQGAGELNIGGAAALAAAIDTSTQPGAWWLTSGVNAYTTIGGQDLAWSQNIVWGSNIVWGTSVFTNQPAWASNIVWGTNTVWGTNIVWGSNIVWGTSSIWSSNIVWGSALVGTTDGQNIVWGAADLDSDNIVWGTLTTSNIVWGTNIVWGSVVLQ